MRSLRDWSCVRCDMRQLLMYVLAVLGMELYWGKAMASEG